jgi:Transposase and inactivated derivatives
MPWVLPGCWIASNLDNMNNLSALTEEVSKNNDQKQLKAKQIFLGIDAHLGRNQVARKRDNGAIQGVQSMSFEELLLFAQKQLSLGEEVYAVYEAGPLGYVLYRRLRELGIKAYVSAPECLEQGKRKHNKLDARKLASRLYSYVQGDREMMRVVRVPTLQEEQLRAHSRQHDQLVAMRKRLGAQGRALVLSQGYGMMKGAWWRPMAYAKWALLLPEWIGSKLELWQANLRLLDAQIAQRKKELIQSNKETLPKGFGAQTMVQLDREIGDYSRFSTRRKIGCFGGFVPREYSTGRGQRLGSITKVGSPRIRTLVIEMVWRLPLFQPNYPPIVQWREALCGTNKVLKKKAAVAVARRLLIDIWKLRTGRTSPQALGLILNPPARS